MSSKKRYSAFDDFTSTLQPQPSGALGTVGAPVAGEENPVERIERAKPSQMLPDRFQPRRLLPSSLRLPFYSGEITCYQAASRWLEMAKTDAGVRTEIDGLLAMGSSFEEHGQIKSITGNWVSTGDGEYRFQIETGERRFWAACLTHVSQKAKEEPLLRVEVVKNPTRQRQVLENRHAEDPSAVEEACEIASLILADLGVQPDPAVEDDYDYFRQARTQRMPAGLWERITPIMMRSRPRMVQLLNILRLPTPLLDLADRYRLPERVLREIVNLPPDQWERLVRRSIQEQLTSDDLAEIKTLPQPQPGAPASPAVTVAPEPGRQAMRGLRRFIQTVDRLDGFNQAQVLDEVADTLMTRGQAERALTMLEELVTLLQARLSRRDS